MEGGYELIYLGLSTPYICKNISGNGTSRFGGTDNGVENLQKETRMMASLDLISEPSGRA